MSYIIHRNWTGFISDHNSFENTKRTLTLIHFGLVLKGEASCAYFEGVFNFRLSQV